MGDANGRREDEERRQKKERANTTRQLTSPQADATTYVNHTPDQPRADKPVSGSCMPEESAEARW